MLNRFFATRDACARLALLALTLFFAVTAQADPAGRIGRIAWLSSRDAVSLYNPESGESFDASLNQPLTGGDILTTTADGRAEIQIGSMTIRLDGDSELELAQIDDQHVRLKLNNGRVISKLTTRDSLDDFTLDTPDGQFVARETGIYRFDTDANSSLATTYYGALSFSSRDNALDIGAGQSAQFWYAGQTRFRLLTPVSDDFSRWSAGRDRRAPSSTYSRYVSPEMTGAEDLDAYGDWSNDPDLGAIWFPRKVDRDWAPFRSGHWVWLDPWGWNWVGNEPWGFAPFHYGRWVQHRGAWGWVPGARVVRPVYSPAMVAWIGAPGVGISIRVGSAPSVGWFPLAPHEVYVPSYRSSAGYVQNINITHVTHITNVSNIINNPQVAVQQMHYVHRDSPRAVTLVPVDVMTHHRPVQAEQFHSDDRNFRQILHDQPVQVAAPIAAPVAGPRPVARGDRPDSPFPRRDRDHRDAPATVPGPGARPSEPPAPVVVPQAGYDSQTPDSPRRAPPPNNGYRETRPPTAAAPAAPAQPPARTPVPAQVETRNPQVRPYTDQPHRESPPAAPGVPAPAPQAPVAVPQAVPQPTPQRSERPPTEVVRPAPRPVQPETHAAPPPQPARVEPPAAPSVPAPAPQAPVAVPQVAPQPTPQRTERPPTEVVRPAPAPVAVPQVSPQPTPQRTERPPTEVVRPAPRPVQPETHAAPLPQANSPQPARVEPPAAREPRRDAERGNDRPGANAADEEELKRRRRRAQEEGH